jgi:phosphomannomutase
MQIEEALSLAQAWSEADPDPETRQQLARAIELRDDAFLLDVMSDELRFGTAGLRAIVGPGPARMNRAVVRRTTAGLARYLAARYLSLTMPPIVVARDARLSSEIFMQEAVGVLCAHGLPVLYFPEPTATPIAAYVARRTGAAACIVITASHNPAEYNGYKLYGENAVQIVPPVDEAIAAEIRLAKPARLEPMLEDCLSGRYPNVVAVDPALVDDYFRDISELRPPHAPARGLRIAYTPLHGLGTLPLTRALREAGFSDVHVVPEQRLPDGRFPTVAFPNPEEVGALDRVSELAQQIGADLILANDPDVDRLAAGVPLDNGAQLALSGNQIGVLLADFVLERAPKTPRPLVIQSLVSSPMLRSVAAAYGARFEQTLTGFKWIWTAALELMAESDVNFVFGYEEALGYSIGHVVRDKDGISAALILSELCAFERARGSSLGERLEELYRRHGLWVSVQKSVTRPGQSGAREIREAMDRISASPPRAVRGVPVTATTDYRSGGESRPVWRQSASLLELELGESGRILVRPSGTEPKLKIYVDLREVAPLGEAVWRAEAEARARALALGEALIAELGMS